jgi:hypothetical protein
MNYPQLTLNIILHVFILFTFLTIFFFTTASKLAKQTVKNEFSNEIGNAINTHFDNLNDNSKQIVALTVKSTDINRIKKLYSKEEPCIAEHNQWVFSTSVMICILLFITFCVVTWLIYSYEQGGNSGSGKGRKTKGSSSETSISLSSLLLENFFTFAIIGVVEVLFFMMIAFKFVPTSPSTLTSTIITTLNENFNGSNKE